MKKAEIVNIAKYEGEEVIIKGWLYNLRKGGKILFLLIRDGTGIIQAVAEKSTLGEELFEKVKKLSQESSLILKGTVRRDERAPEGYEILVSDVEIVHIAQEYPISLKEHGVDFLLDHRHLWIRSRKQHAILKIRAEIIRALRDYFDGNGFTLVDTPIFTPSACEGTTTLFETHYFSQTAYLAQSGQLYNEATAAAFGKVYCFGPTFRAEKSKTRKHLIEFWMLEPEIAFADINDIMDIEEDCIVYLIKRVLENKKKELTILERNISKLEKIEKPFPRITYDECVKFIQKKKPDFKWGEDFGAPEENIISRAFKKPVFVHRFPAAIKAFYMKRDPENPNLALGVDLIATEGYGEIIGGGQREDSLEILEQRIEEYNLPKKAFEWYLDLRRYGSFPHAGFGIGLERTIAWLCGLKHIREAIPFPRMLYRLYP